MAAGVNILRQYIRSVTRWKSSRLPLARETGRKTKITRQFPDQRIVRNHKCLSGMYTFPSKCFQTSSRMCSRLSVGLLSYDGGSTLIRLDRSKKIGRAVCNQTSQPLCTCSAIAALRFLFSLQTDWASVSCYTKVVLFRGSCNPARCTETAWKKQNTFFAHH